MGYIPNHFHRGIEVLIRLRRHEIDVQDNLVQVSVPYERGILYDIIAHGDDQISLINSAIHGGMPVNPRGKEAVFTVVGYDSFSHLGMNNVDAGLVQEVISDDCE